MAENFQEYLRPALRAQPRAVSLMNDAYIQQSRYGSTFRERRKRVARSSRIRNEEGVVRHMADLDSRQDDGELVILDVRVHSSTGVEASESILAFRDDGDCFRVARSPGFARGFAAADLVRYDEEDRSLAVVKRGGNICIQYFYRDAPEEFIDAIKRDVEKNRRLAGWRIE